MHTLFRSLALVVAFGLAAPAFAAPPTADEMKLIVKDSKKDNKTLGKIVKKYGKAVDKDKDTADLDADVMELVKKELKELRQQGIPTNEPEPAPRHPSDPPVEEPEEGGNTFLEKLRDQLVEVRDAKNPKPRLKALQALQPMFETRLEKQEKRYEKIKG